MNLTMKTGIRETKKRNTRQAILQAAANLFWKNGFEKTSVEELARASGIGKGTIYYYFRTKSDILNAFFEDELLRLHKELTTHADQDIPFLKQMDHINTILNKEINDAHNDGSAVDSGAVAGAALRSG